MHALLSMPRELICTLAASPVLAAALLLLFPSGQWSLLGMSTALSPQGIVFV